MTSLSTTRTYFVNEQQHKELANDLNILQELFILALNRNSYDDWVQLVLFVESLPPDKLSKLATLEEIHHYLVRIQELIKRNSSQHSAEHLDTILDRLSKYFPQVLHSLPSLTYNFQRPNFIIMNTKKVKRVHSFTYGDETSKQIYHFNKKKLPFSFCGRSLTTSSLVPSIDAVQKEALRLEVSRRIMLPPPPPRPQVSDFLKRSQSLIPLYTATDSPLGADSKRKTSQVQDAETGKKLKGVLKAQLGGLKLNAQGHIVLETAEDVVHAFSTGLLPVNKQEVFMNFTDTVPWDPYNLVVVDKAHTNSEHFSVSQFGILYVYLDGDCEHRSFAEWLRDKTIFNHIRQIKVFKEYLKQKMLNRWHQNVSHLRFNRRKNAVHCNGVRFHLPFSLSLWKVNSLSIDLLTLTNFNINPFGCYTFEDFFESWQHRESQIMKYLHKYFKYSFEIINGTIDKINQQVMELELEKRHKPFVSDLPISIQKKELDKLLDDIEAYRHRRDQINQLLTLYEIIVGSYMVQFVEGFTKQWMELLLHSSVSNINEDTVSSNSSSSSSTANDDINNDDVAMLQTELKFNDDGKLLYTSDRSYLKELLLCPLTSIVSDISSTYKKASASTYYSCSQGSSSSSLSLSPSSHQPNVTDNNIQLISESLLDNLEKNEVVKSTMSSVSDIIDVITRELCEFCSNYEWLTQLNEYLNEWEALQHTGHMSKEKKPKDIEEALMKSHTWLNSLSQIPTHFVTSYSILCIHTQPIVNSLRPRLLSVIDWVQEHCISTICNESSRLTQLAHQQIEAVSTKRYDLEGFAHYSQNLRKIQEERETEAHTLELVLSLLNTLTRSGVMVPKEYRSNIDTMERIWDECEDCVADASDFVEAQTPLKAQGLQENMEACEKEVVSLVSALNQTPYNDSTSSPKEILSKLDEVQNSVISAQSRLGDLGKWKKAITGESYTITGMNNAVDSLNGRRELWKCRQAFDIAENEWLKVSFKKLDITEMESKLNEWMGTLEKLSETFPDDDPVLSTLKDRLVQYQELIPSLTKLHSDSLKNTHWHTMLSAVEVDYDPTQTYNLQNLLVYKLLDSDNADIVNEVCQGAERESNLKHSIDHLQQKWEKKIFMLQQKPISEIQFAFPTKKSTDVSVSSTDGEKVTKFDVSSPEPTDISDASNYIVKVINVQEILQDIEEDIIQLQVYCGFTHATGSVKQQLEHWSNMLKQLRGLVELLSSSQTMWWNTVTLFGDLLSDESQEDKELQPLQNASQQFQKITNQIFEDPLVLSLIEKRRGQKSYKDVQGDTLRLALQKLLTSLEAISQGSKNFIEKQAASFPRLLMLSTSEMLQALTHHGNPLLLLPILSRLFPGINDLSVIEVKVSTDVQPDTPREEGFQIVSVSDKSSEVFTLCIPLPIGKRKTVVWLNALERALRYSLSCHLTGCLMSLPRQFMGIFGSDDDDVSMLTWLADNVYQAVMLAIETKWYSLFASAIDEDSNNKTEVPQTVKSNFEKLLEYFIKLLRSSLSTSSPRILSCLRNIIALIKHRLEIISNSIAGNSPFPTHIFYKSLEPLVPSSQTPSRLGSVPQSLTSSRTSMTQSSITTAGKLHLLPEALVGSTKSLYNSRLSLAQQQQANKSSVSSVKSLLPPIPTVPTYCCVQCGNRSYGYGFEYMGSSGTGSGIVLSAVTERAVMELIHCITEFNGGIVMDKELPKEVAKVLGRPFFTLSCLNSTISSSLVLTNLLSTVQSGSVLIFYNIDALPIDIWLLLTKWLQEIYEGMKSSGLVEPDRTPSIQQTTTTSYKTANSSTSLSTSYSEHKSSPTPAYSGNPSTNRIDWYSGQYGINMIGKTAEMELLSISNASVKCNALFGFIGVAEDESIIEKLTDCFRTVSKLTVDPHPVVESLLLSKGFTNAAELTKKVLDCTKELQDNGMIKVSQSFMKQLSQHCQLHLNAALNESNGSINSDSSPAEESSIEMQCVMNALLDVSGVSETLKENATNIISTQFNANLKVEQDSSTDNLRTAIKKEMEERHFRCKPEIINKIVELHSLLSTRKCVFLSGPSSSGKTTLYQILAQSYSRLNSKKEKVHIVAINPEAYTLDELYGGYSKESPEVWLPGILTRLFQQSTESANRDRILTQLNDAAVNESLKYWFVLNGFDWNKLYWLENLLIQPHNLQLPNGGIIKLSGSCRILIETSSFPSISPSFLSQCGLIQCVSLLSCEDLTVTWLEKAIIQHNISTSGLQVLSSLMDTVLPSLLEFTSLSGNSIAQHLQKSTDINVHLVHSFLALLSAILERNSPKQDDSSLRHTTASDSHIDRRTFSTTSFSRRGSLTSVASTPNVSRISHTSIAVDTINEQQEELTHEFEEICQLSLTQQYQVTAMFVFALIWSFGGYISSEHLVKYSDKVREIVSTLPSAGSLLPETGQVFDYYLDLKTYQFLHWSEKKRDKAMTFGKYVTLHELEKYLYIIDLYQSFGYHVLLVGDEGSGKSSFLKHYIQSRVASTSLPITSSLTPFELQSNIVSRLLQLKKRQQGTSKKPATQRNTFLLDDLHLSSLYPYIQQHNDVTNTSSNSPTNNISSAPPVVHLVSFMAEYGVLHDMHNNYQHSLNGVRLLGTSTLAGAVNLTPSLLRHLKVVPFFSLSNEGLCHIMQQQLMNWIQTFPMDSFDSASSLAYSISVATLTVLVNMKKRFHCSSTHPQYQFSLHELSSVMDGLLLMNPKTQGQNELFIANVHQNEDKPNAKSGRVRMSSRIHKRQPTGQGKTDLPSLSEETSSRPTPLRRAASRTLISQKDLPPIASTRQTTGRRTGKLTRQSTMPTLSAIKPSLKKTQLETNDEEENKKKATSVLRSLFRLWCHECSRVYTDRCTDTKDRIWFTKVLETCMKYCYCGAEFDTKKERVNNFRNIRPGKLPLRRQSTIGVLPPMIDQAAVQTLTLQLTELSLQGIDCSIMQTYLPKEKQKQFLSYDQVAMKGEDLSSLLFAKLPVTSKGKLSDYLEIGDGQLHQILNDVLSRKCDSNGLSNVIINKEGMERVIHLCRTLVIPGTHTLLLGHRGTGRKTSCRVAAAVLGATLFELNGINNRSDFQTLVKEACVETGLKGKTVVLLIDSIALQWYDPLWNIIIETMRDGLSNDLFTPSELLVMSSKIPSGKLRRTAEALHQALAQVIHPKLHVVIVWDTPVIFDANEVFSCAGDSVDLSYSTLTSKQRYDVLLLEEKHRSLFDSLLKHSQYKNHYLSYTKDGLSHIALQYWQSKKANSDGIYSIDSSMLEALSYLASHIHLSANDAIKSVAYEHIGWLSTLRDFIKCLQLAYKLANDWKIKKEKLVGRLHSVLGKLYDIEREANNLKYKLNDELVKELNEAQENVKNHMAKITAARDRYMAASQQCKDSEETINNKTKEVKLHKENLDKKFESVAPEYYGALEALSSVARSIVNEVMGYRAPPGPLMPVFQAICLLFDRPATWFDCQQLMVSQHFFQSLRFFDKDAVPQYKITQMERLLVDQKKFSIEKVQEASEAAVPIVQWLNALVDYRRIKSYIQPYKNRLALAENALSNAQKVYVTMRQEMLETKAALEETVEKHKAAQKVAKAIECQVEEKQQTLKAVNDLLNSLSNQRKRWETELSTTQTHLDCLATESLLVAANCTYLGHLPSEVHSQLWNSWIAYCKGAVSIGSLVIEREGIYNVNIKLEKDFNLARLLSTEEESIVWEREETFPDELMLEKCLHWRINCDFNECCSQVIFDPLNYFTRYINGIAHNQQQLHHLTTTDLLQQLQVLGTGGNTLVLQIATLSDADQLYDTLYPILTWSPSVKPDITMQDIQLVPNFHLYIVVPFNPFTTSHSFISFLLRATPGPQLSSLLFSQKSLSKVFLSQILHGMRRELCIQQRAMLADFSLHKQQIDKCQESIRSRVLEVEFTIDYNQASEELTTFALETESQEHLAMIQVKETQNALSVISQQVHPYESLALHGAQIFLACQQLEQNLPQVKINLQQLLDIFQSLIKEREGTHFHSSQSSLRAYLNHLETTLVKSINQYLSPMLFSHQLLYFPLLVALYKEVPMIRTAICNPQPFDFESLLDDLVLTSENFSAGNNVVNAQSISAAQTLQETVPLFKGLSNSLQNDKNEWSEFLKSYSSLLVPLPDFTRKDFSLSHKLLLWKTIGQSQFFDAVEEYISLTVGPDCIQKSSFKISTQLSPHKPILSLYYDQFVLECISNEAKERGALVVVLSALLATDIERLSELLSQCAWVVIDHLYHCKKWMDIVTDIFKVLQANVCHADFRCFLPLPINTFVELAHQVDLLSYHVIALPYSISLTSELMLQEYHSAMRTGNNLSMKLYSNESLKQVINKIASVLPIVKPDVYDSLDNDNDSKLQLILAKARSSILLVLCYLQGTQCYTIDIGHTVACIVTNTVPDVWYGDSNEPNKSLIDFIKWIRHEYYD